MRILFCNFEYPPLGGGGGVVNALLAEELAKRHEVTVLTSGVSGMPASRWEKGVHVLRVRVPLRRQQAAASMISMLAYLPLGARAGKKLVQTTQYDVINTHFVLPTGPVGDFLGKVGRIPNVLSVHGGDLYDPSKWTSPHRHALLRLWIRRLLRRADQVVGQSRNTLKNIQQYYAPEVSGVRIPLGIRRPSVEVASRKKYHFDVDDILLVTVGRLVARKATDHLVSTMATMDSQKVHLLILGSGPEEQRLRRQTEALKVTGQIHFMGFVEEQEKFQILSMSDVFVSTSQHEGFGLVFLEAMASGLPIVCYDHGGQTDFLENGRTGYLVPLNDREVFQGRCLALATDSDLRHKMGKENLQRVETLFIDKCAVMYERVFQEVIARHRH